MNLKNIVDTTKYHCVHHLQLFAFNSQEPESDCISEDSGHRIQKTWTAATTKLMKVRL